MSYETLSINKVKHAIYAITLSKTTARIQQKPKSVTKRGPRLKLYAGISSDIYRKWRRLRQEVFSPSVVCEDAHRHEYWLTGLTSNHKIAVRAKTVLPKEYEGYKDSASLFYYWREK